MRVVVVLILFVVACGRIGFDSAPDLDPSDGPDIFDTGPFPVTPYSVAASNPALEWNGVEAGLVFEQDSAIGGVRLSALGESGDAMAEMVVSGRASRPRLCATDDAFVVAFDDGAGKQRTIFVGDFGGSVTAMTTGRALAPAIARSLGKVGVVWRRDDAPGSIGFGLLTSAGPQTKLLEDSGDNHDPTIAASTNGFGIVWQQVTGLGERRLLFSSVLQSAQQADSFDIREEPLVLAADDAKNQLVAWDGSSFVVVWTDSRESILMMARIGSNGTLELQPTPITTPEQGGGAPSLAVRNGEVAIAFRSEGSIRHIRVDHDGVAVGDPFEVARQNQTNLPSIIATDLGYLVAWQADVDGNGSTEIYARAFAH